MPVVIALLNSYAGLAATPPWASVLMNKIQIITGSLDGTSGLLLSILMCRAMNRSAFNVIFARAFGKVEGGHHRPGQRRAKGSVRSITAEETGVLFDSARSVIIVPGYGNGGRQAQHGVSDLAKLLQNAAIDVKYAIHPVAGRHARAHECSARGSQRCRTISFTRWSRLIPTSARRTSRSSSAPTT